MLSSQILTIQYAMRNVLDTTILFRTIAVLVPTTSGSCVRWDLLVVGVRAAIQGMLEELASNINKYTR